MDEIQNCIADAQYGEALRGMEKIRPVEQFPSPPETFNLAEYVQQQNLSLQAALSEPLGSYFLKRFCGKGPHEEIFDCLEGIRDFRRSADKNANLLVHHALRKIPARFKRLESFVTLSSQAEIEVKLDAEEREKEEAAIAKISISVDVPANGNGESSRPLTLGSGTTVVVDGTAPEIKKFDETLLKSIETQLLQEVEKHWDPFTKDVLFERYMRLRWYCSQKIELKDFTIFRDLGRGAFGVVSGARMNTTGAMVAIKCMNRKLIKGKKALKLVQGEKDILALLGDKPSHFTIWLKYAWQDKDMYYLAIPLATGGDLMYHLQYQGYFSLERTIFTSAEIALGLNHLHTLGIIYRDLKPENVLLDDQGHARISDMGLAFVANGQKIRGRAGTPGYWAPEMLKKDKYGVEADWWSFGCCVFEFLSGRCPFSKQNTKMERDDATLTWPISMPQFIGYEEKTPWPETAGDIIMKFLQRDPATRLGRGKRGFDAIKQHPFYGKL